MVTGNDMEREKESLAPEGEERKTERERQRETETADTSRGKRIIEKWERISKAGLETK